MLEGKDEYYFDMKKHLWIISICCIALMFVACDKGEAYYQQWEGEYLTKQIIEYVYADGSTDKLILYDNDGNPLEYPVQDVPLFIFRDRDLYVQTYGLGDPFMPGDSEDHILRLKSPQRISKMKDSIETVIVNAEPIVIMRNGGVYTIFNGSTISPNPIKAKKVSPDKIILTNSKEFTVITTTADGNIFDEFVCHWEYAPILNQNETYTWEAELHAESKNRPGQLLVPEIVRHKIVIYKK